MKKIWDILKNIGKIIIGFLALIGIYFLFRGKDKKEKRNIKKKKRKLKEINQKLEKVKRDKYEKMSNSELDNYIHNKLKSL